ncbi:MAG: DUF47 domain-containing protein [Candidatus Bilamarchaeaceae archaeon]
MKRIKEFFLLKDDIFFDLLMQLANTAHATSEVFTRFISEYEGLDDRQRAAMLGQIGRHEKEGDAIVRKISDELFKHFITPIDREDIHAIASELDDEIDIMEEVAKKMQYYRLETVPEAMKEQARISLRQIGKIREAVEGFENGAGISDDCKEVCGLEDKADALYEMAMTELFSNKEIDPILLIKLKDIYDELEDLTDLNQKLAIVLEGIMIKHA